MKTLKEVPCGTAVIVKKLSGEGPVKRRIMDKEWNCLCAKQPRLEIRLKLGSAATNCLCGRRTRNG